MSLFYWFYLALPNNGKLHEYFDEDANIVSPDYPFFLVLSYSFIDSLFINLYNTNIIRF